MFLDKRNSRLEHRPRIRLGAPPEFLYGLLRYRIAANIDPCHASRGNSDAARYAIQGRRIPEANPIAATNRRESADFLAGSEGGRSSASFFELFLGLGVCILLLYQRRREACCQKAFIRTPCDGEHRFAYRTNADGSYTGPVGTASKDGWTLESMRGTRTGVA